jgi:double-stranded uracil-DNA glycosylase
MDESSTKPLDISPAMSCRVNVKTNWTKSHIRDSLMVFKRMIAIKPTRSDLLAAKGTTIPDVITPGLRVLFCGINPGLYSGATGHHFARPGNRFWRTLHQAGFTSRYFDPTEQHELLSLGYGITNLVARTTATADELSIEELLAGKKQLEDKIKRYRPRVLAVLGIGAYRMAFQEPKAVPGMQTQTIWNTRIWILPNPSGLNAHYQLSDLVEQFRKLREAV